MTQDTIGTGQSTWLAGIYEKNFYGEAWLSWSVLSHGTTRFQSRQEACTALRIRFDGDSLVTSDPAMVKRARAGLAREALLNSCHAPGQLALFVHPAPHLDGARLMTFTLSDSTRSVEAMVRALTPAEDAGEARVRLAAAVTQSAANPERDAAEDFMEKAFGITPDPVRTAETLETLETLTDDFRGFWSTFIGNTAIGVLHTDCWTPAPSRAAWRAMLGRRCLGPLQRLRPPPKSGRLRGA